MAKAGRPSSYKPEFCQQMIECLSKGHSVTGFAGEIGRCKDTVFEWIKKHPEFADAAKIATSAAVYFWEKQLILAATTDFKGNITAIIFGLKNRAHEEWRDVHKLEHTGKDGGPIKTQETSSRDKLLDLVSRIAKRERETESHNGTTH